MSRVKQVRQLILRKCRPGEFVSENSLAAALRSSRTPVREALAQLGWEGIVEVLPKRGTQVRKLSQEEVHEIVVVRLALESTVIRELIRLQAAGELDIGAVWETHRKMEIFGGKPRLSKADRERFTDADLDFHCRLSRAAEFHQVAAWLANLRNRFRLVAQPKGTLSVEITAGEHERILNAIEGADLKSALTALEDHFRNALYRWDIKPSLRAYLAREAFGRLDH